MELDWYMEYDLQGYSIIPPPPGPADSPTAIKESWPETVEAEVLNSLPESEINRQTYCFYLFIAVVHFHLIR